MKYGCLYLVVTLITLALIFNYESKDDNSLDSFTTSILISKYAEKFVSSYLKDPKSAEYDSYCKLKDTIAGIFKCTVNTTSKNSFGAYVGASFDVSIKYDTKDESVSLLNISN